MPKRCVLGIDPGIGRCGWAVVTVSGQAQTLNGSGCISTPAKKSLAARLLQLDQELEKVLSRYHPSTMAIEQLFFTKNVTTAMAVSHARGIALLAAARHDLTVDEVSPTTVKQSLTGYGRADKRQMGQMIKILLGLPHLPPTDDEVDAIGIALSSAHRAPRL